MVLVVPGTRKPTCTGSFLQFIDDGFLKEQFGNSFFPIDKAKSYVSFIPISSTRSLIL